MSIFEWSAKIASIFSKRWKRIIVITLIVPIPAFLLFNFYFSLYYELYQSLIGVPYLKEVILSVIVIIFALLITMGLIRPLLLLFELSEDNIFGRIWQSTYVVSIVKNTYRTFIPLNGRKIQGWFSRWHKNIHELVQSHFPAILLCLTIIMPLIAAFITVNLSIDNPANIDSSLLWEFIFWSIGILVTTLFFFSRYASNKMEVVSKLRYFPYLLISIIAFSVSTLFAVVVLTSVTSDNAGLILPISVSFIFISVLILGTILLRIIYITFTEGLYKIQENAARRVIFKQASNEGRKHIADEIIEKITSTPHNKSPQSIDLLGEDFDFENEVYISDINKSKLQYVMKKYEETLLNVQIPNSIGDRVAPSDILLTITIKESENNKSEILPLFSDVFKTSPFNPWNDDLRDELENNQALEDYLAEAEQNCKKAIERGNTTQLNYYLRSYLRVASTIGNQRRGYKNENVELPDCAELLASSLTSVFLYQSSMQNSKFTNPKRKMILSEITEASYKAYQYSGEETVSKNHQFFTRLFLEIISNREYHQGGEYLDTKSMKNEMGIK